LSGVATGAASSGYAFRLAGAAASADTDSSLSLSAAFGLALDFSAEAEGFDFLVGFGSSSLSSESSGTGFPELSLVFFFAAGLAADFSYSLSDESSRVRLAGIDTALAFFLGAFSSSESDESEAASLFAVALAEGFDFLAGSESDESDYFLGGAPFYFGFSSSLSEEETGAFGFLLADFFAFGRSSSLSEEDTGAFAFLDFGCFSSSLSDDDFTGFLGLDFLDAESFREGFTLCSGSESLLSTGALAFLAGFFCLTSSSELELDGSSRTFLDFLGLAGTDFEACFLDTDDFLAR
jgi:hypothetical protein